jgi:predicted TIM-barrel fold metal-dependent hydrolase
MQHPTERFGNHEMFDSLRRWVGVDSFDGIPLESTVSAMDETAVRIGTLSAWCGPQGWLIDHGEVQGAIDASPGRFAGLASADLSKPMEAVRELRRAVRDLGFKGLRVVPWLWGLPPNDRRYYPLFAECCELDVPFCTQVGHTGPLRTSETGRPIPYLEYVALDFPELKIVCGHIGVPWMNEMLSLLHKFPNVFVDTSAYTVRRFPPELVEYMTGKGRSRVLFGTNYPMLTPAKCLEAGESLRLDEEASYAFLSGNAVRVFNLAETA